MFLYKRTVHMRDTDATGVIYFCNQLQIGLEAFEAYLLSKQCYLQEMIDKKNFLIPIVHAEADFFSPITLGQKLKVKWNVTYWGTRSFTHCSDFFLEEKRVGTTSITHATISQKTRQAIPIPERLRMFLNPLGAIAGIKGGKN